MVDNRQKIQSYLKMAEANSFNDTLHRQDIQNAMSLAGDDAQLVQYVKKRSQQIKKKASTDQGLRRKNQILLELLLQDLIDMVDNVKKRDSIVESINKLSTKLGVDKTLQVKKILKTSTSQTIKNKRDSVASLLEKAEKEMDNAVLRHIYLESAKNIAKSLGDSVTFTKPKSVRGSKKPSLSTKTQSDLKFLMDISSK